MKKLSEQTGSEIWVNPRYAIARFMLSKAAFKTAERQPMIFTLKPIKEKFVEPEVQLHLRFEGKDLWNKLADTLDIDVYIPLSEFLSKICGGSVCP